MKMEQNQKPQTATRTVDIRVPLEATVSFAKPVEFKDLNLVKISTLIQDAILHILGDELDLEENQAITFSVEDSDSDLCEEMTASITRLSGTAVKQVTFKGA